MEKNTNWWACSYFAQLQSSLLFCWAVVKCSGIIQYYPFTSNAPGVNNHIITWYSRKSGGTCVYNRKLRCFPRAANHPSFSVSAVPTFPECSSSWKLESWYCRVFLVDTFQARVKFPSCIIIWLSCLCRESLVLWSISDCVLWVELPGKAHILDCNSVQH